MTERQLKDILGKLEVPYAPETWEALSQKLDALQDPPVVDAVDKLVYRKIGRLETPYDPASWNRMAHRLDVQRRRTLVVRFGKVLEAAAVVLLLLRFAPDWSDKGTQKPAGLPSAEKIAGVASIGKADNAGANGKQPAAKATIVAENGMATRNRTGNTGPGHSGFYRNASTNGRTLPGVVQSLPVMPALLQAKTVLPELPYAADGIALRSDQPVQPLATPEPALVNKDFHPDLGRYAGMPKVPRSPTVYFAASLLGEWNQYRWSSGSDYAPAFGAAAAVGRRGPKWTVEGGAGYVRKQFTPKSETEILSGNQTTGYTGLEISGVEADVLQVPVRIMRKVGQWGGLRLLALTGATGHFALYKDYDFDAVYFEPPQTSGGNLPKPSGQPKRLVPGNGILEGGSLGENTWASLDLGIQLEYPLGKRSRLFLQPAAQIGLNAVELGPEPVYNNSFRVQAGVQTDL